MAYVNFTDKDLNTGIDKPKIWWNLHLVLYNTSTSRVKPSSNGQLSDCSWSFGVCNQSHWIKTKIGVGRWLAMNVNIGFNLQLTATPGFHSLFDWCYLTMWLFSSALQNPENDTVMEKHGAKAEYSMGWVWCMLSRLKQTKLNRMQHTGWSKLQTHGRLNGGQNATSQMRSYSSGFRWRLPTVLVCNELKKSKPNFRPSWQDTLHKVLQNHGGYIDGGYNVSQWYWVTPRMATTFPDNGTISGHLILG